MSTDEDEMAIYGTDENMALDDSECPSSDAKSVEIDL